jgi:hypothetical protein
MANPQRRDYRQNLRRKIKEGCTWCGAEVPPPVTGATYCSDGCVQADMEGIDDLPSIVPLAYSDPAYVARKWTAANETR